MNNPGSLTIEATTRYLTDPEFHARVRVACSLVHFTARQNGVTLSVQQETTIVQSAAFGVLMAEKDVTEWADAADNHQSMQDQARALGMSIVPKTAPEETTSGE